MSEISRRSIAGLSAKYEDDPIVTAILEELVRLRQESDLAERRHRQALRRFADQEHRIGLAARRIIVLNKIERWVIGELGQRDRSLLEQMRNGLDRHLGELPPDEAADARVSSRWCA